MNILEALAQQNQKVENGRVLCDDGLLSVSDAVFEANLSILGYNDDDIDFYLDDIPLDKRHKFLQQVTPSKDLKIRDLDIK